MKLSSGILGLTLSSVVALASANAADMYAAPVGGGYKDFGPIATWAGFYAGVNGGWAWGTEIDLNATVTKNDCDVRCSASGSASHVSDGGFGGGQIGYNIQRDRLVFGLEADFQGAGLDGAAAVGPLGTVGLTANATSNVDWFGTVRGRLGLTFSDDAGLIYVTGGFAYGGVQHKLAVSSTIGSQTLSDDRVEAGWVLGAGYERFITQALSLKVEYQYIDLGEDSLTHHKTTGLGTSDVHATYFDSFSTVRAGLNYHIGSIYEPLK